jgi:hypothetical protein
VTTNANPKKNEGILGRRALADRASGFKNVGIVAGTYGEDLTNL